MKLRFIIILGLLLLAWNSCRHNETKAPLAKEAYGYARLDTLKQLLTINDETAKDTADAVKTYITTYADFGVGNEKIDLREKVYVYARESTVELVSHMDTDRLAGLLHGADKLALHNLPRSPMTYLVPGLAAILLLLYYIGYRMVLNMRMSGWLLLRTVWGFSVLMLVLMIIGLFAKWPVLGRETIPVKAEQMNGVISGTAVSTDILTGKPIGSLSEKTAYFWEGQYIYASGEISHGELGFLRDAYNEMTATLRRLVWIIGCFFLFLGMRIVSAWALQRIESLTKIMHLGMMMAFCGGAAAELQKCRAAAGAAKAVKTVLAADIAPGEKTAPGARAMLGMKTVPAMETVSAVMQPTKAVPTTIRMMKAVPAAMRITKTVPAKLLRPGRTIVRPNSYYAVLCCKTERVPSGTLFAFKVCFVRVIVRRLKTVLLVEE